MISAAVVDASVAVKWVVEETGSAEARSLSRARLAAPDWMLVECANILWKKVRVGDLTKKQAQACLRTLAEAPVALTDSREALSQALDLSLDLQHPVYDCVYLALAARSGVPLVTADERLVRVVRSRKRSAQVLLLSELPA